MSGIRTRNSIPEHVLRVVERGAIKPCDGRQLPALTERELRALPQVPDWAAAAAAAMDQNDDVEQFSEPQAREFKAAVEACRDAIKARKLALLRDRGGATIEEDRNE